MAITVVDTLKLNRKEPDIDARYGPYGPYSTLEEAKEKVCEELGPNGADVLCRGLTVGVKIGTEEEWSLEELWFRDGTTAEDLITKSADGEDVKKLEEALAKEAEIRNEWDWNLYNAGEKETKERTAADETLQAGIDSEIARAKAREDQIEADAAKKFVLKHFESNGQLSIEVSKQSGELI